LLLGPKKGKLRMNDKKVSILRRTLAFLIDHFLIILFAIALFIAVLKIESNDFLSAHSIFIFIFAILLYFFRDLPNGTGPGKSIFRLKVVNNNFEKANVKSIMLRNFTLIIWPIEFLIILVSKSGLRISDRLCKTKVVNMSNTRINGRAFISIFMIGIMLLTITFFVFQYKIKTLSSYIAATEAVKQDSLVLREIGEFKSFGFSINSELGLDTATYQLDVKGKTQNKTVNIILVKDSFKKWKAESIKIIE
jgi:uncharacterized RDD family membrane protein YckC